MKRWTIFIWSNFQMNDNELEAFVKIADENGEISKNDIIIQVHCGLPQSKIYYIAYLIL